MVRKGFIVTVSELIDLKKRGHTLCNCRKPRKVTGEKSDQRRAERGAG